MDKLDISGEKILDRVLMLLKLRNIKQKDFFAKINTSKQAVARWRAGGFPSTEVLYLMAKELNVSLDWLVTGNEDGEPDWEKTSPAQIVNRIEETLEKSSGHKVYEDEYNIFAPIMHIIDPRELNLWREGKKPLNTVKLCEIAEAIGVSVQFLMTGSNISKEEYTQQYGYQESSFMELYRQYHNLNKKNRELANQMIYSLFGNQNFEYLQNKLKENNTHNSDTSD